VTEQRLTQQIISETRLTHLHWSRLFHAPRQYQQFQITSHFGNCNWISPRGVASMPTHRDWPTQLSVTHNWQHVTQRSQNASFFMNR